MAFKFDGAEEGYGSSLDLFKSPPIDTAVFRRNWVKFRPSAPISRGSPIQFTIPGTGAEYKDLKKIMLYVKVRITKPDNSPITEDDSVGFVNLAMQSLFRQVDVTLQQRSISTTLGLNYAYKSLLDNLLMYTEERKETRLQSQLFFIKILENPPTTTPKVV